MHIYVENTTHAHHKIYKAQRKNRLIVSKTALQLADSPEFERLTPAKIDDEIIFARLVPYHNIPYHTQIILGEVWCRTIWYGSIVLVL